MRESPRWPLLKFNELSKMKISCMITRYILDLFSGNNCFPRGFNKKYTSITSYEYVLFSEFSDNRSDHRGVTEICILPLFMGMYLLPDM